MRIITVANRKGGTGKTSISVNLAAGLARYGEEHGWKVLLLDLDPQANALKTVSGTSQYSNLESLAAAIADNDLLELLTLERPSLHELVRQAPDPWYPNLFFIPSREALLVEVRRRMAAMEERVATVGTAFDTLEADFDFVVIDTGPSIDDLLITVLAVSDYVLVPVEMDEHAIEGAVRVTERVQEIARETGYPAILGYVPNKFMQRRIGDRNAMAMLRQLFGGYVFDRPIPHSVELRYSQAVRSDIFRYSPDSPIASAMWQLVLEAVRRMGVPAEQP